VSTIDTSHIINNVHPRILYHAHGVVQLHQWCQQSTLRTSSTTTQPPLENAAANYRPLPHKLTSRYSHTYMPPATTTNNTTTTTTQKPGKGTKEVDQIELRNVSAASMDLGSLTAMRHTSSPSTLDVPAQLTF
jgi:hypothetical protein